MHSNKTLAALTYLALAIALAISVVPPLFLFAVEYRYEQAAVDVEAEINARIVGQIIRGNPELWTFEQLRLEELLSRRSERGNPSEIRSVYAADKVPVAQSKDAIARPHITGKAGLYDSGRRVGHMEVSRSLRPAILQSVLTFVVSSFFSLFVFMSIRNLPLRALRRAFNELADEKEKAQVTLQSIGDAVITSDASMRIEYLNPVAEMLTGWSLDEARGARTDVVFKIRGDNPDVPPVDSIKACLEKNDVVDMTGNRILVRRTDNAEFHVEDSAAPIRSVDGKILGAVMVFHDVTDRILAQHRLQEIAYHDPLTGLPNRTLFQRELAKVMIDADERGTKAAVIFLDLDRFKTINDSLGHGTGDELLILVAKRLKQCVRESDIVCRMGGDEFTAALCAISVTENAGKVAAKIIDTLAMPFNVHGHELRISASIGISIYPEDGKDIDALLKNADTAMYNAKAHGRNNYQYYGASMNAEAAARLRMENALHAALAKEEFFLEYQPKLDVQKNCIAGSEALVRWDSGEYGRVMPLEFIPLLEDSGDIVPVGNWILKTAVTQAKRCFDAGYPIVFSVNVSPRQFRQKGLARQIADLLDSVGLPPAFLRLEITESLLMDEPDLSEAIMRELIAIGVRISLDDFGTGYSSLGCLRRFPINEVKIDRSLVVDMNDNETALMMINAVIELGQALGMTVTAEGVETDAQRMRLHSLGCNEIQGYLVSRPLDRDAFDAFLAKSPPHSAVVVEDSVTS